MQLDARDFGNRHGSCTLSAVCAGEMLVHTPFPQRGKAHCTSIPLLPNRRWQPAPESRGCWKTGRRKTYWTATVTALAATPPMERVSGTELPEGVPFGTNTFTW
jgi:hypothetical protein